MWRGPVLPNTLSRRDLLKATGRGLSLAALAPVLGCAHRRSRFVSSRITGSAVLTILYAGGGNAGFDVDYYRRNHLPLIMDLYGPRAIRRLELRRVVAGDKGPVPPYLAATNIWIRDRDAFAAAGAAHGATLRADVPNFTSANPVTANETVWGESGHKLDSPEPGQRCLTILYPREAGARWNADYYRDHHMELIMSLYGTRAIRRFEVRKTDTAPGASPPFLGSVNIYIEDQSAFDTAGQAHARTLADDMPNFSNVHPRALVTEIVGIG